MKSYKESIMSDRTQFDVHVCFKSIIVVPKLIAGV